MLTTQEEADTVDSEYIQVTREFRRLIEEEALRRRMSVDTLLAKVIHAGIDSVIRNGKDVNS
jgi:hypothetical protein